ncbi:hypothetical protein BG015_004435 [Linnemannia schmuckeri]|uniref:Uncharacterized protein n=1 Tax=Linnemannia schmuckeri TaxID=64567 RepID=A0A9P5RCU7_9FUNG|nr:hypothetical protein BG015_004435 [Linnemannia schmuckeri]
MSMLIAFGADGKTPAAPPPSPSPFRRFLSQQQDDSDVVPFNEMLIGNNTNSPRHMYSCHKNKNSYSPSSVQRNLRARCCFPKNFTAAASPAASLSTTNSGINHNSSAGAASFGCFPATCITCYRPIFATNSSSVYPSPELSDLDDDDIAALDYDTHSYNHSYNSRPLRRRPSLDLDQNRTKRTRRSPPCPASAQKNSDDDALTVISDTVGDDVVPSNPAPFSPAVASSKSLRPSFLDSPPYHPADVFPNNNDEWHEQVVEYDWASSTDEDERKTVFSDSSCWSGIDCRDESLSELETRFGLDGMDSPPYQPQDYNELNPAMDPQETRWFEQQLTAATSGSRRRREDSPPYVPFDYNTLNSEMNPNEDRFFEQPRAKYTCTAAAIENYSDSASCDGDVSSNDMSISDDDMSLSDFEY